MRIIGNFLWFILGGVFMGISSWIMGSICFISIVGIPWGKACFVIGQFTFFPFGKEAISRKELYQTEDIGTSGFGVIGNIIWFLLFGLWLAIGHIMSAVFCFYYHWNSFWNSTFKTCWYCTFSNWTNYC